MSEPKPLLKPLSPPVVEPRLWADGRFADDQWHTIADDVAIPAEGHVLITLARWRAQRTSLATLGAPIGIVADAGASLHPDSDDLGQLAVIALAFPKFTDGRAYSTARRLRNLAGYRGQIRATGDVLLDQIPLMLRSGFDAFEIRHLPTIAALERGQLPALMQIYQPTSETPARPWISRRDAA